MYLWLAIAGGGAIGALARHFTTAKIAHISGFGFPFGTLVVNILGSFLMGILIEIMAHNVSADSNLRAFLAVGILGSFTTFSTFSLDVVSLFERGELLNAGIYIAASVILSIIGLFLGLALMRFIFS